MTQGDRADKPQLQGEEKKPYEAPQLQVYGDIAAVTRTVGMAGMSDGGAGTMKATQP